MQTGLRVLHVFSYFRPDFTGEGLYLEKLAPQLTLLGIRNDVIVANTAAAPRNAPSAPIDRVRFFGRPGRKQRRLSRSMTAWFAANVRHYDVVHFHALVDRLFIAGAIARLAGCRIVQSCTLTDGLGGVLLSYRPFYRPLVRLLCRLSDAVVAISPKLYEDSVTVLPPDRVHHIPQGVAVPPLDPTARAAERRSRGFTEDDFVLLFVGGLCQRKDVMFLVEHHPAVTGAGKRLRLVLVGPDIEPDYADALRHMIAASACRADIMLIGYLDDPSPAFRMADAFVFASRSEGFGNVLLEAMAFGLPVVSRRLPGVTDSFIEHGKTGFLFDTPAEYRAAVRALVQLPANRQAVAEAARRSVIAHFDLAVIAARYAGLYRQLVQQRRRR